MKTLILALALLSSTTSFARTNGPSVGGGTAEAPWVRSQQAIGLAMEYIEKKLYIVDSITFKPGESIVVAEVQCRTQRDVLVFNLKTECRKDVIIPVCIPERSIELDPKKSSRCD